MNSTSKTRTLRAAICISCALFMQSVSAQGTPPAANPSVPAKALDNYTIQRLIVTNDRGEVLLEKNPFGWMTPAVRSSTRRSVKEAIASLASDLGIEVERVSLAGLYTYKFEETPPDPEHASISFRTHYLAKYAGGQLKKPADASKHYEWVAVGEVAKRISMDSLRTETVQILEHPDTLWGGSFLVTFENGKLKASETIESPYPLRAPGCDENESSQARR